MSDPPLSDNDFKNKMAWVWTTLKQSISHIFQIKILYEIEIEIGFI